MSGLRDSFTFKSRRPVLVTSQAAVACGQPQAANAAIEVLQRGGNAADAAVACAAAMAVTQPISTGLGGDAFCLFYDAKQKIVRALNGNGRSPKALTLEKLHAAGYDVSNPVPRDHGHTVTVPGAAAAWCDTVERFGSKTLPLSDILQPAIRLAENGFPVSEITSHFWKKQENLLQSKNNPHGTDMCVDGRAPKWGETFVNKHMANVLKRLGEHGKEGFYRGDIAESIVHAVQSAGGLMTLDDMTSHTSTYEAPLSVEYKGVRLWETVPSSHGIVALMALNILKHFDLQKLGHNSADYLHVILEAFRKSFADGGDLIADPTKVKVKVEEMLNPKRGQQTAQQISMNKCMSDVTTKDVSQMTSSDTIYLTVVDRHGNACSFINSNYMGFGTGIVPQNCGFTLQNRGSNFSLEEGHPNAADGNKRPYHTIIPAMVTDDKTGALLCSYGVMGGFMQPQGHVQVLLNMLEFGMNPQEALDQPRVCLSPTDGLFPTSQKFNCDPNACCEEGIADDVIESLKQRGHDVTGPVRGMERSLFGRGHVITRGAWWRAEGSRLTNDGRALWAGSDARADGIALGY